MASLDILQFGGFARVPLLCLTEMKAGGAKNFKEVLEQALSDIDAATCCAVGHPGEHHVSKGY